MITSLTEYKFEYVVNKLIEHLPLINKYEVDKYASIGDFYKFKAEIRNSGGYPYRISYILNISEFNLLKITVSSSDSDAVIEYTLSGKENKELVNKLTVNFFNRIIDIEDAEFRRLYPDYNCTQGERDHKLSILLGKEKGETSENKSETEKPVKRKRWKLFN